VPNPAVSERPPTYLELLLGYDRASLVILLILFPLVCWAWIVVMARDMYGPMTGASAWMMTRQWDASHVFLLWAMWAVMMVGMMLPTAAPLLLLYGVAVRRQSGGLTASQQIYALAAGYAAVWALFSVGATAVQRILSARLIVSPMMTTSQAVGAGLLIVAGVYQLTPLKLACLQKCQSPLSVMMHRWRSGVAGAFRMGIDHGAYCLGCCWALMLLLFAGGVMNLAVILALTAFVAFEKVGPFGAHGARVSGVLLIAAGTWMLLA
jgi:predicted metal-binding membrane protein